MTMRTAQGSKSGPTSNQPNAQHNITQRAVIVDCRLDLILATIFQIELRDKVTSGQNLGEWLNAAMPDRVTMKQAWVQGCHLDEGRCSRAP